MHAILGSLAVVAAVLNLLLMCVAPWFILMTERWHPVLQGELVTERRKVFEPTAAAAALAAVPAIASDTAGTGSVQLGAVSTAAAAAVASATEELVSEPATSRRSSADAAPQTQPVAGPTTPEGPRPGGSKPGDSRTGSPDSPAEFPTSSRATSSSASTSSGLPAGTQTESLAPEGAEGGETADQLATVTSGPPEPGQKEALDRWLQARVQSPCQADLRFPTPSLRACKHEC